MNIIEKLLEYEAKDNILKYLNNGDLICGVYTRVNNAKKKLREECNILFINVMKSQNDERFIIAKTKNSSYIYEYNLENKTLELKGERKNVNS